MPVSRPLPGLSRAVGALSISLVIAAGAFAQPVARQAAAADPLARLNESLDALTRKVWPSVVQIIVSSFGPQEGPPGSAAVVARQQTTGSGFVIDDGSIMTHAHVINGARRVQID